MSALLDTPYARRVTFAFNHQTLAFEGETERKRERERERNGGEARRKKPVRR